MSSSIVNSETVTDLNSGTISIPAFDSSLGSLQAVEISFVGTAGGTVGVENLDMAGQTLEAGYNAGLDFSIDGTAEGTAAATGPTQSFSAGTFDGTVDFAGNSGTTFSTAGTFGSNTEAATSPGLFSGTGNITLDYQGSVTPFATGQADVAAETGVSLGAGTITVEYLYGAPLPPPPPPASPPPPPPPPPPSTFEVTQTVSVVVDPQQFGSSTASVAQFNPVFGTLRDVRILDFATVIGGTLEVQNIAPTAVSDVTLSTGGLFDITVAGITSVAVANGETITPALGGHIGGPIPDFAPPSGTIVPFGTEFASNTITITNDLSDFVGVGSLDVVGNAVGNVAFDGNDIYAESTGLNGSGIVEVIYDYTSCFAPGTRIATRRGEVAVEDLKPGDVVRSALRDHAEVIWTGFRNVNCAAHPRPRTVWPIRVRAHAFAVNVPSRDLFLSPDHAVHVEGCLIPIRLLVNDRSISQVERETICYWHVELDAHDIVLAENLPAESYLDAGNRAAFDNGGAITQLHPSFVAHAWESWACAPLLLTGPVVAKARERLAERAFKAELMSHVRYRSR
jgi:hypothetical protein